MGLQHLHQMMKIDEARRFSLPAQSVAQSRATPASWTKWCGENTDLLILIFHGIRYEVPPVKDKDKKSFFSSIHSAAGQ